MEECCGVHVHCGPPVRFHATLYQCPETANEMSVAVSNRIDDLTSVLRMTEDHSITQLQDIGQELDIWKTKVSGEEGGTETQNCVFCMWCE